MPEAKVIDGQTTFDTLEAFISRRFGNQTLFNDDEMMEILKEKFRLSGGIYKFCDIYRLSPRWVYNIVRGHAYISKGIANPIGFRKVSYFERMKK